MGGGESQLARSAPKAGVHRSIAGTIVFALLLAWPAAGQEPVGETKPDTSILGFAEHLYAERDHYRAITEYKRFLYTHPDSGLQGWVRLRIGQSYLAGGRLPAAQAQFARLRRQAADRPLSSLATFSLARAYYLDGRHQQAIGLLDGLLADQLDWHLTGAGWFLSGCAHLRSGELAAARRALERIGAGHELAERAVRLIGRLDLAEDLPSKSPLAAGLLSVVPGLGHFYLEQYSVGLTALAWNGLFGYAAYEAFRHRRWGVGALLATLELLWYSGTVYGAVSGAERYNRDAVLNYLDGLDEEIGLDTAYPPDDAVHAILVRGQF